MIKVATLVIHLILCPKCRLFSWLFAMCMPSHAGHTFNWKGCAPAVWQFTAMADVVVQVPKNFTRQSLSPFPSNLLDSEAFSVHFDLSGARSSSGSTMMQHRMQLLMLCTATGVCALKLRSISLLHVVLSSILHAFVYECYARKPMFVTKRATSSRFSFSNY